MPELPEVETVRRGLERVLKGRRLARVLQRRADLRTALPPAFAERLTGRTVQGLRRRGKYMLIDLDDGQVWLVHLGMSGSMTVGPADARPPGAHDHVVVETDGGVRVTYCDARRFGTMDLFAAATEAAHPLLARMGPEPLDPGFTAEVLAAALAGRITPIKAALLDQRTVAGIGNIYASEALFRARLSPRRLAATVTGRRAERLVVAIRTVLEEAIAAGGSSLRDYVQANGELGYFQHAWAVYGREGERCPGCTCDAAQSGGIRRIQQSGRSTFYCPARQR
ncbi:MAG: bifunctional DNA-formamidopyrimidine glycosylase/DNA-(apurinic or apyrimidinic site) lyase [Rhodospirillaceae bacterium]|nr:bifunctional DNA-formamidopyrimidine glycosylase/DNA-(apurinic or apyrimidinic site) lyase [Rhodospirillaceae bacterium]